MTNTNTAIAELIKALDIPTVSFGYRGQQFTVDIAALDLDFWRAAIVTGFTSKAKGAFRPNENDLDSVKLRGMGEIIAKLNRGELSFAEAWPSSAGRSVDPVGDRVLKLAKAKLTAIAKASTGKARWVEIIAVKDDFAKFFEPLEADTKSPTWIDEAVLSWVDAIAAKGKEDFRSIAVAEIEAETALADELAADADLLDF